MTMTEDIRHHPDPADYGVFIDAAGAEWKLTATGRWLRFGKEGAYPRGAPRLPLRRMVPEGYLTPESHAERKLAEVDQTIRTFQAHYGHSELPTFKVANDLAEAIRQVLDRKEISSKEGGASDDWSFTDPAL